MASKKKKNGKSSALVLSTPNSALQAAYDKYFDPEMTEGAAGETGLAPFISTEDGIMKHGGIVIGTDLDAIILGVVVEHALYPVAYSRGNPSNPVCFFVGAKEVGAAPDATSPQPQSKTCATCIKNAFGSAPNKKAKACRQTRRLLIMPNATPLDPEAQLYRLRVPPTSVKHIAKYDAEVRANGHRVEGLVTHIKLAPHDKNRFEMTFKAKDFVNLDALRELARRAAEAKTTLFQLPMISAGGDKQPVKGGRRAVVRR